MIYYYPSSELLSLYLAHTGIEFFWISMCHYATEFNMSSAVIQVTVAYVVVQLIIHQGLITVKHILSVYVHG